MTNALQLALAGISFAVAIGVYRRQNVWPWICVYWIVLTVKNVIELL